ncbi:MAG TPA: (d)CMP kinase [Spirochaetia bacterium]|nr:(d)CMP kinase [Spirochaetia bacterium]
MIAAIDGPAGVGKSTVARRCADAAGLLYVNSGNFYRAITLAALEAGAPPGDFDRVLAVARACRLSMRGSRLCSNGRDVEDLLHSDAVDEWVAAHSSIPEIRRIVNTRLREIVQGKDVLVEGRDIGTVVFPRADIKIFLDADVSTRAARRHAQGVSHLPLEEVEKSIAARDTVDRNKPTGRLLAAPDALLIDTSHLTIDQVCDRVIVAILVKKNNPGDIRRL